MGKMIHALPTLTRFGISQSVLSVRIAVVFDKSLEQSREKCFDTFKYVQAENQKHKHALVFGRKEREFVQDALSEV